MTKLYEYVAIFPKSLTKEEIEKESIERIWPKKELKEWKGPIKSVTTNLGMTSINGMDLYSVVLYGL